jgi:CRP/FNR family transcriptional regulator, cyclic AMP receptor protein
VDTSRLSAIPLFSDLTESELAVVAGAASETTADEGQTLVTAGDFGHALYAIEAGTATVNADGVPLGTLGPGDVFGEIAVLASGRRTSSVVAASPMRLIVLFKRDVWALERSAPTTAERLRTLIASRQSTPRV